MTNKEAAEILQRMKSDFPLPKAAQTRRAQNDALDAAIKALKAESCDDAISRKAAIDAFEDTTYTKNEIRRRIAELPPAQSEQMWIPVNEGLPEEDNWLGGSGKQFSDSVLISIMNSDDENERVEISYTIDGEWALELPRHCKILAWMPLPEPYKEDDE